MLPWPWLALNSFVQSRLYEAMKGEPERKDAPLLAAVHAPGIHPT